jgi:hypothetical protein
MHPFGEVNGSTARRGPIQTIIRKDHQVHVRFNFLPILRPPFVGSFTLKLIEATDPAGPWIILSVAATRML